MFNRDIEFVMNKNINKVKGERKSKKEKSEEDNNKAPKDYYHE